MIRAALVMWLITALIGCTTTRAMTSVTPERAKSELRVGDTVRVTTLAGQRHQIKLTAVDDTTLWGTTGKGQRLSFKFEDLHSLESTRFSAGKTAGAIGGTLIVIYVLALVAVAKLLQDAFSSN